MNYKNENYNKKDYLLDIRNKKKRPQPLFPLFRGIFLQYYSINTKTACQQKL